MSVKVTDTLFFSSDFKKVLQETGKFTRDVPYLNQFQNHFVFVYGTLKRGNRRADLLKRSTKNQFCGIGVTESTNYDLLLTVDSVDPNANYPIAFDMKTEGRSAKVKGELWLVDTNTLLQLDKIEANGYLFDRVWVNIQVGKEIIPSYMYVGVKGFWKFQETLLDLPILKENGKPYHFYHSGMADKMAATYLLKEKGLKG
jgi:gamma-glutamylcyclotransferase (GGCT)/AIG2-like uncharacterized protein YtfP